MATPYYTHSAMTGAPQLSASARAIPDILAAVLVNGFNTLAPSSATAASGVLTLNFGSAHGYEALAHIEISGASVAEANGVHRVATVPAGNQLTCAIPGIADGSVGGTISTKVAAAGWTEPFAANSTTRVFRMGGGNQRYLRIVHAASSAALARGYESMTALSTGTGPFPTVAQIGGSGDVFGNASSSDPTHSWWALSTESGMYMQIFDSGVSSLGAAFFGDLAEAVKAADAFSTLLIGSLGSQGYIARSHTGSAGAVAALPGTFGTSLATPSPIADGQRFLYGVPVEADTALRGLLPGGFSALPPCDLDQSGVVIADVTNIDGRAIHWIPNGSYGYIALAIDEDLA